jgi:hypothetical protein
MRNQKGAQVLELEATSMFKIAGEQAFTVASAT